MPPEWNEFVRWGASHWAVLGLLAAVAPLLICGGLRLPEVGRVLLCRAVAAVMLAVLAAEFVYRAAVPGTEPWQEQLPLHFCSVMMAVAAYALWTRARWACALTYFSVLTASVQALITPALHYAWPHPRFLIFFLSHSLLFLAALMVPAVLGWRARRGDALRTLLLMDAYILLVIPANMLLGTNYGFTQEAPAGSILEFLGPAPWYYLALQLPGWGLFGLLSLPVREK